MRKALSLVALVSLLGITATASVAQVQPTWQFNAIETWRKNIASDIVSKNNCNNIQDKSRVTACKQSQDRSMANVNDIIAALRQWDAAIKAGVVKDSRAAEVKYNTAIVGRREVVAASWSDVFFGGRWDPARATGASYVQTVKTEKENAGALLESFCPTYAGDEAKECASEWDTYIQALNRMAPVNDRVEKAKAAGDKEGYFKAWVDEGRLYLEANVVEVRLKNKYLP